MTPPSGTRRAGSALIIVLGLLAVLMMLGLTFSVFARTEHAGSTNLKNGAVARQSLQTAVGHVMEAIDLSFGSPSNNWPVCVWPQAWLASSELEAQDYYQSDILADGEVPAAQILTDDAAKFLTPSQLALAKSAAVGWAPIYAAIDSEGPRTDAGGGLVGNKGRDNADSVIGRYAFIALETTGLLDANAAGSASGTGRADNTGDDPFTYKIPASSKTVTFQTMTQDGDDAQYHNITVSHTVRNANALVSARNGTAVAGGVPQVSSFADLRAIAGGALDESKPAKPASNNEADLVAKPFPADLFNTFYASLADLDPDGQPKVAFPADLSAGEVTAFAERAFPAMVKVFANARADTSLAGKNVKLDPASNKGDQYTFFEGARANNGQGKLLQYDLSRARLATIAAIDAQDDDFTPGQIGGDYSSLSDLSDLTDFPVNVVDAEGNASLVKVDDTIPNEIRTGSYLNLPCTENVPMLSRVAAAISFNPNPVSTGTKPVNGIDTPYIEFQGGIMLYAVASYQNDGPKPDVVMGDGDDFAKLEVECEFLPTSPREKTTTGFDPDANAPPRNIAKRIWNKNAATPHSVWKFQNNAFDNFAPDNGASQPVKFSETGKSTIVAAHPVEFTVTCYAAMWPNMPQNAPQPDSSTKCVLTDNQGTFYYPPTLAQEQQDGWGDLLLPFRFKTMVKIGVDGKDKVVQQVPAPRIDGDGAYRVRVDAALYHPKGSRLVNPSPSHDDWVPGEFPLAFGWAMCLDPVFGFDTTSLKAKGDDRIEGNTGLNFWINNVATYCNYDGSSDSMWHNLFKLSTDPTKLNEEGFVDSAQWNYLQKEWLFNKKWKFKPVTTWMLRPGTDNKTFIRPDMMHSEYNSALYPLQARAFCMNGSGDIDSTKVLDEMKVNIPNEPFESVGQLGTIRIGPYETLSTIRSYRFREKEASEEAGVGGLTDFHRVLDYFAPSADRANNENRELFSSIARGRVNLNMPPLVRWNSKKGIRATTDDLPGNPFPVVTALYGAFGLSNDDKEFNFAATIAKSIAENAGEEARNTKGFRKPNGQPITVEKTVVRRLSELGGSELEGKNPILEIIVNENNAKSDREREAYISQCSNAFTTRGQTFLVIVRADAYTPRYGEESSTGDGTTLATTHAVLELFRDPEYARYPDGSPLEDEEGHPVYFHNWYIKSFHVL